MCMYCISVRQTDYKCMNECIVLNNICPSSFPADSFKAVPLLQFFFFFFFFFFFLCVSVVSYVAFVLSLFVPHLSFV